MQYGDAAVVEAEEDVRALGLQLEQRHADLRRLEVQAARKEIDLRRAIEERQLVNELRTVNQLTLRKVQASNMSSDQVGRLKISEDSLAQVVSLENQIRLEDQKTQELQAKAETASRLADQTEQSIAHLIQKIDRIKQTTGWDRDHCASRGYINLDNKVRELKKRLSALDDKQFSMRTETASLTARIEYLTTEVKQCQLVDQKIAESLEAIREKQVALADLADEKKSLNRIMQRKEVMLKSADKKDDMKSIKQLEGDKRVLHNELSRMSEAIATNAKSISAQEGRLRLMEARIAATNGFLRQVFDNMEKSDEDTATTVSGLARPNSVSLADFESLQQELAISRHTIAERDAELLRQDAQVEMLEKNISVLQNAIVSRTSTTQQDTIDLDRECQVLTEHLAMMKEEFMREYERLTHERDELTVMAASQEGVH